MQEFSGADGELIERLMAIVDDDPTGVPYWWVDVSHAVADAVGGCTAITPETDRTGVDGTIGREHQGNREVVARVTWMNHLRLRLAALVADGLAEDFLVGALHDHVDARLAADATPAANAPKTRYEEWIAEQATGTDNLELSLIARAIMQPDAAVDLSTGSAAQNHWRAAAIEIDAAAIRAWHLARTSTPAGA